MVFQVACSVVVLVMASCLVKSDNVSLVTSVRGASHRLDIITDQHNYNQHIQYIEITIDFINSFEIRNSLAHDADPFDAIEHMVERSVDLNVSNILKLVCQLSSGQIISSGIEGIAPLFALHSPFIDNATRFLTAIHTTNQPHQLVLFQILSPDFSLSSIQSCRLNVLSNNRQIIVNSIVLKPGNLLVELLNRSIPCAYVSLSQWSNQLVNSYINHESSMMISAHDNISSSQAHHAATFLEARASTGTFGDISGAVKSIVMSVTKPVVPILGGVLATALPPVLGNTLGVSIEAALTDTIGMHLVRELAPEIKRILVPSLTETLTDALTAHITQRLKHSVTIGLTQQLTDILTHKLDVTLTNLIAKRIDKQGSAKLAEAVIRDTGHMVTRSLGQSIVPSIIHTINHSPMNDYFCFYCYKHNTYCNVCQITPNQMYYAQYYANYYSVYFGDYFTEYWARVIDNDKDDGMDQLADPHRFEVVIDV